MGVIDGLLVSLRSHIAYQLFTSCNCSIACSLYSL